MFTVGVILTLVAGGMFHFMEMGENRAWYFITIGVSLLVAVVFMLVSLLIFTWQYLP